MPANNVPFAGMARSHIAGMARSYVSRRICRAAL